MSGSRPDGNFGLKSRKRRSSRDGSRVEAIAIERAHDTGVLGDIGPNEQFVTDDGDRSATTVLDQVELHQVASVTASMLKLGCELAAKRLLRLRPAEPGHLAGPDGGPAASCSGVRGST